MSVNTVKVRGLVRDATGEPYEGAVIEVWLNSQIAHNSSLYGNEIRRDFSNSRGIFTFNLVPSSIDGERENFYTFKIIKDTTNIYNKIINGSLPVVNFDELPDYIPPRQRTPLLGNLNRHANVNPITLPQELVGLFTWQVQTADGETAVYSAPGEIYFVALNGVVQSSSIDYVKRSSNVIEFINTPMAGDLVSIQYRI